MMFRLTQGKSQNAGFKIMTVILLAGLVFGVMKYYEQNVKESWKKNAVAAVAKNENVVNTQQYSCSYPAVERDH